ncbi:MAG: hypothetical protein AB7Q91_15565 [Phycisphaerales bacterium]
MPRFLKYPIGAVLNGILLTVTLGAILAAALVSMPRPQPPGPAGPSERALAMLLYDLGLHPAHLAAGGVAAEQAAAVVAAAREHYAGNLAELEDARAAVPSLRAQIAPLEHLASTGRATQQQLIDLASARAQLAAALAACDTLHAAAFTAAAAGLSTDQRTRLATLNTNARHEVPIQYRTAQRSDAQWTALRNALIQLRVSTAAGAPDAQAAALLEATGEEPAVAAAAQGMQSAAAVAAAWQSAVNH